MSKKEMNPKLRKALGIVGKVMIVLLETVLLAVVALYCAMFVLAKGPSVTARNLFVLSVRETSAMGFLANMFFTDEEIAIIEQGGSGEEAEDTDSSLIVIPKPTEPEAGQGPQPDAWGLVDEDGDGIIVEEVRGEGYTGFMMVVLDPSRVVMASSPADYGKRGYTVAEYVAKYDAVAGINGGGFLDPGGKGNGSFPETMVVYDYKVYYPNYGVRDGFVGIDENNILHVGKFNAAQAQARKLKYGVGFGPVLISNGVAAKVSNSGVNPRTAIGQRPDGAILMLVIDGRQVSSLGATYKDLQEIFLSYGAVNACNLDGGSSTVMWYQGDYINHCASVVGIRPMPTAFVVLKQGVSADE